MDIRQLTILKKILEAGSVTKAASQMNLAQSAISRRIAALEEECGGRIFKRDGRGVKLTELGERILPHIDIMLKVSRDIAGEARSQKDEIAGNVRIAAITSIARAVCVPMIHKLHRNFPKVNLCISEVQGGNLDEDLSEGRIDIAIFSPLSVRHGREDHVVDEWQTYLFGVPGPKFKKDTMKFSDLAGLPLILPWVPGLKRRIMENAASIGIKLNIVAEVSGATLFVPMLLSGDCYLLCAEGKGRYLDVSPLGVEVKMGRLHASRVSEPSVPRLVSVSTAFMPQHTVQMVAQYIIEEMRGAKSGLSVDGAMPLVRSPL